MTTNASGISDQDHWLRQATKVADRLLADGATQVSLDILASSIRYHYQCGYDQGWEHARGYADRLLGEELTALQLRRAQRDTLSQHKIGNLRANS